jgi:Rgg/GadR/MutR family transcriptional activator
MDSLLGQTHKKLRESKNTTVKEMAGSQISFSQLHKFENGTSSITVEKLAYLLNRLNISAEEFESTFIYLNKDAVTMREIAEAFWAKNTAKLRYYMEKENFLLVNNPENLNHFLNVMQIKSALRFLDKRYTISEKEIRRLERYLFSLKEWSGYDIWLFGNCVEFFMDSDLRKLTHKMLYPEVQNIKTSLIQSRLNQVVINLISVHINNKHFTPVDELFSYLEHHFRPGLDMTDRAMLSFYKKLVEFRKNPFSQDKLRDVEKCISAFETLDCFDLVNLLNDELGKYKTHI